MKTLSIKSILFWIVVGWLVGLFLTWVFIDIALPASAWGQDNSTYSVYALRQPVWSKSPYQEVFTVKEDSTVIINRQAFAATLLDLYDEYAKECYKDSTVGHIPNNDGTLVYRTGWIHKQPTFPGFIERLRGIK